MKIFNYLTLCCLALVALNFSACKKKASAELLGLVPSDAFAVMSLNTGQVWKKMDMKKIQSIEEVKAALAQVPDLKKYLDNPEELGIDINKGIVSYGQLFGPKEMVVGLYASLKDAKKLESLLGAAVPKEALKTENGMTYFKAPAGRSGESVILAWNGTMLGLVVGTDSKLDLANIFKPKDKNILGNADAQKALSSGKDFIMWMNIEQIVKVAPDASAGLAMAGLSSDALSGSTVTITQDFQNGKAESVIGYNFGAGVSKEFGGMFNAKNGLNAPDFLPGNLAIGTSVSINPKGIWDMAQKRGAAGMIEGQAAQAGVPVKELIEGLSGDMLFGFGMNGKMPDITLVVGLKNAALGKTVLAFAEKMLKASPPTEGTKVEIKADRIELSSNGMSATVLVTDKAIIFSTNKEAIEKAGKMGSKNENFASLQGNTMGMFVDYDKLKDLQAMLKNTPIEDAFVTGLKSFTMSVTGNQMVSVVNFTDANTNALNSIFAAAIEAAKKASQKRSKIYEDPFAEDETEETESK